MITLITDISVLLVFAFNIYFLKFSIKREKERIDIKSYQLTDFGVKIGNIPKTIVNQSTVQVKITITDYVKRIIEQAYGAQPQVDRKDKSTEDLASIVNIHFGLKDFSRYNIMLQISQLIRDGQIIRLKQRQLVKATD